VIDRVDGFSFVLVHEVNLGQVVTSLSIAAGLILFESLPAFFLPMSLDLAKVAKFAISIAVISVA
jgi:hypothetical protein